MSTYRISVTYSLEIERDEEPSEDEASTLLIEALIGMPTAVTIEKLIDPPQWCFNCQRANAAGIERCSYCGWSLWTEDVL